MFGCGTMEPGPRAATRHFAPPPSFSPKDILTYRREDGVFAEKIGLMKRVALGKTSRIQFQDLYQRRRVHASPVTCVTRLPRKRCLIVNERPHPRNAFDCSDSLAKYRRY